MRTSAEGISVLWRARRFQVIDHQATCEERKEKTTDAGARVELALLSPARWLAGALAHLLRHFALCALRAETTKLAHSSLSYPIDQQFPVLQFGSPRT